MKRIHLPAVLLVLLLALCVAVCACAAEIRPLENEQDDIDLKNGTFCLTVKDADKVFSGGWFTASLFLEDHYDAKQIEALAPGDTVLVNGKTWTVREVVTHESDTPGQVDAYEIYTEEENDGYIVFSHAGDGCYRCITDDWTPVSPVGDVRVALPLPDRFEYLSEEADAPGNMDTFVDALEMYGDSFVAYNTVCTFEDGMLVRVIHASYPAGPAEDAAEPAEAADPAASGSEEPIPVWKFCHGRREGLETAVITTWYNDCEGGPSQVEVGPEEEEELRSLAINGVITGKANDMGVTGGTSFYSFMSPDGEHLLTIELYKGWIVAVDGMYNYSK